MKRPLTIIGGGLAGLGLANGLRLAGVPVELHEAGRYPRHRVCGEFLTGLNDVTIRQLGIEGCFADAVIHRQTAWFRAGRQIARFQLPEPALGISRHALDARMAASLRERGGILNEGSAVAPAPDREGTILATGRVAGKYGWFGMKGHWQGITTAADLELHLGARGYLGLSLVEDGFVNVCGLFDRLAAGEFPTPLERFFATLREHRLGYLADRLAAGTFRDGSLRSVSNLVYASSRPAPAAAIGDHHGLIPPFTGNGMTIALEGAASVLPHAIRFSEGHSTWQQFKEACRLTLVTRFGGRRRHARLLHPWLLHPVLQLLPVMGARLRLLPFRRLYHLTH
jgi:flavin-dependent dehydrogenase